MEIPDPPVLSQEECSLIAIALEHKQLYNNHPITSSEQLRIAEDEEVKEVCKCVLHTDSSNIESTLLVRLKTPWQATVNLAVIVFQEISQT